MNQVFPALQLLLTLSLALTVGLPLLVWLLMQGYRDKGAQLWFVGIFANTLGLVLLGLWQSFSAISAVLFVLALLTGIGSMRWELGRQTPWRWLGPAFLAYALLQLGLEQAGLRMNVGYTLNLFVLVVCELTLIGYLYYVGHLHRSRGLPMVAIGVGLVVVANLYRLVLALIEGGGAQVFSGSPSTNLALVVITLVSTLNVVGYGGFVMEKLHRRRMDNQLAEARAVQQQHVAEQHAEELATVVRQRDDMILLNSRFSVVNNLAIYSSAIVHEISQPLQALNSILDTMSLKVHHDGEHPLQANINHALMMTQKISGTLESLRSLMAGRQVHVEPVEILQVLDEIFPVLQSQASKQGVTIERKDLSLPGASVRANKVLLQRVMFNLVTNAFEALSNTREPTLTLTIAHQHVQGGHFVVLTVQDNGPGFPDAFELRPSLMLRTTKEGGSGVGLSFAQMLVETWRGEMLAYNVAAETGGGAMVEIRLPTAG